MEKEFILNELVPLFKLLAGDDQDSVRLLAIEACAGIGECSCARIRACMVGRSQECGTLV